MGEKSLIKIIREKLLEVYEIKNTKGRKYSKDYCVKTPCKEMGFSQKASCRPYKNCYKNK